MTRKSHGHEYWEVYYTVEGSDKVYKHKLRGDTQRHFWFNDELFHWLKRVPLKSIGDGTRSKTIYEEGYQPIRVEISYYNRDKIFLSDLK